MKRLCVGRLPAGGLAKQAGMMVLALSVASCAVFQRVTFTQPSLELDAVRIESLGLSGGYLTLVLDVYNPNGYALGVTRLQAGLDLEDVHFGAAEVERRTELPPQQHTRVEIPVSFSWEGVGAGARGLLERGSVRYALETRFRLDTGLGERSVTLRNSGIAALQDLTR